MFGVFCHGNIVYKDIVAIYGTVASNCTSILLWPFKESYCRFSCIEANTSIQVDNNK